MDDVARRLDKAVELGGFKSRRQMAEVLGISYNTLNTWIKNGSISEKGAVKIASKIPIAQNYLLTGEGIPEKHIDIHELFGREKKEYNSVFADAWDPKILDMLKKAQKNEEIKRQVAIPRLTAKASARSGNNIESIDVFETGEVLFVDRSLFKTHPKNVRAIQVDGYSMVPVLLPDSWVFFTETSEWTGDALYVLLFRNILMVKLVEADPKTGNLWIKSANPDYDSWQYDPTQDQSTIKIIGRVIRCMV
ncbi:LexA family transcriptional regulator [Hydrogenimonas urashimensis]|uniref:LexA family transcriptional regulator n=1 Tax=Hydrogenimonas urashimensis TaxID=2740515 RepID=UPI001914F51B|nr:S24 family peptidase [Hydrogenimonas urashimensis]